jgi:hypothetical protein
MKPSFIGKPRHRQYSRVPFHQIQEPTAIMYTLDFVGLYQLVDSCHSVWPDFACLAALWHIVKE